MVIDVVAHGDPRVAEADAVLSRALPSSAWRPSEEALKPHGRVLVAQSADRLVGALVAWIVVDEAHLLAVGVDESARRSGVAGALLSALEALGRTAGCVKILLEVGSENHGALALYRRRGFDVVHTRAGYYPDGSDGIEMELRL